MKKLSRTGAMKIARSLRVQGDKAVREFWGAANKGALLLRFNSKSRISTECWLVNNIGRDLYGFALTLPFDEWRAEHLNITNALLGTRCSMAFAFSAAETVEWLVLSGDYREATELYLKLSAWEKAV